jgi:hypothetical protein
MDREPTLGDRIMTELSVHDGNEPERTEPLAVSHTSELVQWAYDASQAHKIAQSLARTSFVPASLRGKPEDITAAILAGQELGLRPMASLRSMDIIQGTPALRAHAMRGLVQSRGHAVQLVESTETKCVMRGRRAGEQDWQEVVWTIERANRLGLTGKNEWKKQPQTMLVARATGEICRLVAADALYAMPYASEELYDSPRFDEPETPHRRVTAAEIVGAAEPDTAATDADEQPAEGDPWATGGDGDE